MVRHYAGPVTYNTENFIEKNRDTVNEQVEKIMRSSSLSVIQYLFSDKPTLVAPAGGPGGARGGNRAPPPRAPPKKVEEKKEPPPRASFGRASIASSRSSIGGAAAKGQGIAGQTIAKQFAEQLSELISTLSESNPRYVRCIKPNNNFSCTEFNSIDSNRQLRCAGMLEAIRIRKAGYAVRIPLGEFANRYKQIFGKHSSKYFNAEIGTKI